MSNIACYLQATTKRLDYLEATIHSINKLSDKFQEKFVSIHGEGITLGIVNLLETTNWKVDLFTGDRISAFKRSINSISADYIFYIEDDIELLDFPDEMYDVLKLDDSGRKCGLLSMNLGGSTLRYPHAFGDFPTAKERIIQQNEKTFTFVRKEGLKNAYFFEFPCVVMEREMLMRILPNLTNTQIEISLSLEFEKLRSEYYKASICKPEVTRFVEDMNNSIHIPNFDAQLETVKFYKLLDPNQGGILNGVK